MKRLVLILSGGGAKGAFQAGAWSRILKDGLNFDGVRQKVLFPEAVFGVSVGALNGSLIAEGQNMELVKLWNKTPVKTNLAYTCNFLSNIQTATKSINPLREAVNYVTQLNETDEYYFLIISCFPKSFDKSGENLKKVPNWTSLNKFLLINELVKLVQARGNNLYSKSGKVLKSFHVKIIRPLRELGSALNFTRSAVMDSYFHGYETTKEIIQTPDWG